MSNRANLPAFPRPASQDPTGRYPSQDGATLREYLTGQALVGVLAINAGGNPDYELVASHAVALADLTLIALDDVTHEDAVKRAEEARVNPFTGDTTTGELHKGEKEPAAAALQGGGQLPTPRPESFRAKAPVIIRAVGQTLPPAAPLGPEYEQPRRYDKTSEDPKA